MFSSAVLVLHCHITLSSFLTLDFSCLASPCSLCSSLSLPSSLFFAALFSLSLNAVRRTSWVNSWVLWKLS
ncbi:uncharacterized protein EDB91DRAFT_1149108 [Suillus paluster]|uniref:uncharacterized protein n=1 Tax=Suillus paluster TaxID=48578 RepID=UPI001B8626FC|nr:uncharacterized protein EDB91DRAFT_1149108 [Suillus paluster]KAG1733366.1 hypothetical protein EDB91DRAFT_1149108 [Suillus paluster]